MNTDSTPARAGLGRRVFIPVAFVLAAVALVVLVAMLPSAREQLPAPESVPVNVEIWPVVAVPELADTLQLSAVVEPALIVEVAAEVAGQIERFGQRREAADWRGRIIPAGTPLEEGQPVSAGAALVHLNEELLQARFERADAQFDYDEREYRRIEALFERGTTSKTELDDAGTQRDISKAARDEATRELARATIVAPIDGILNRLPVEVGEYAAPGDVVAEIVDIDHVKVAVDVPERDVYFLRMGDRAEVVVRAPDDRTLSGEVTYISELADEAARTTRMEITVGNPGHELRSGQIVKVRLTRRVLKDVIMIPLGSVIPMEVGRVVYVVDDQQKAQRRDVELGLIKGRSIQVLSGLAVGDRLIVVGHRYVGPGQPVTVVREVASEQ